MNRIGRLTPKHAESDSFFTGRIQTLEIDLDFWLEYDPDFSGDGEEPRYVAYTKNRLGETVAIGCGWHCCSDSRNLDREYYIALEIDDPSLPRSIVAFASTPFREDEWFVFWDRQFTSPFKQCLI